MRNVAPTSLIMTAALAFIWGFTWVPAAAEEAKIKFTKKDCRRLVRHQARADVAYKPGVDVRGK